MKQLLTVLTYICPCVIITDISSCCAATLGATIVAQIGGPITDIQPGASINDGGLVAFVASQSSGQSVYVGDGSTAAQLISFAVPSSSRPYGTELQINNSNQVAAVDGTGSARSARIWDANNPGTFTTIGNGRILSPPIGYFDSLGSFASMANDGQLAFAGLEDATWDVHLSDSQVNSFDLFSEVTTFPAGTFFRFKAADGDRVVVGSRQGTNKRIVLHDITGIDTQVSIATTASGLWNDLGVRPGISDDGEIVTFFGDLTQAGATTLGTTAGPGIFASVPMTFGRETFRVVETGPEIGGFEPDSAIGVTNLHESRSEATVVYKGVDSGGAESLFDTRLKFLPGRFDLITASAPNVLVSDGDTISGLNGTIQGIGVTDPVSNSSIPRAAFQVQTSTGDKGIVAAVVPTHKVVLAWGESAPASITQVDIFGTERTVTNPFGSTPAFSAASTFQESVRAHVQQQFTDSGIEGVVVVNGNSEEGATNVYFAPPMGNTLGQAVSGIDRFNLNSTGEVITFVQSNIEIDAETVTHEVGHALGLRHVNPDGVGALSVMDYDIAAGDIEVFSNSVTEVTEPPTATGSPQGFTHNPLYHLKHYVDGVPQSELEVMGIMPGDWDRKSLILNPLELEFDFALREDLTLYDVTVLKVPSDPSESTILSTFPEITLGELELETFSIMESEGLSLLASSTDGGDFDISLALGNPFNENALVAYPADGVNSYFLQMESSAPAGFETLTSFMVMATAVPEPTTLSGDYNQDGIVNIADYTVWRDTLGTIGVGLAADGTGPGGQPDGIVDQLDYAFWKSHFGQSAGSGALSNSAIPEPPSVLLLALSTVVICSQGRRFSSNPPSNR